jgi:hypothetical protein
MGAHSLGGAERSLRTSSPSATAYIELCGAEFSEKKTEDEHPPTITCKIVAGRFPFMHRYRMKAIARSWTF